MKRGTFLDVKYSGGRDVSPYIYRDDVLSSKPLDNYDIIDAHAHIGPLTAFHNPETEPGDIIGLMDRIGIKIICASGMDCLNNDVAGGNERL